MQSAGHRTYGNFSIRARGKFQLWGQPEKFVLQVTVSTMYQSRFITETWRLISQPEKATVAVRPNFEKYQVSIKSQMIYFFIPRGHYNQTRHDMLAVA